RRAGRAAFDLIGGIGFESTGSQLRMSEIIEKRLDGRDVLSRARVYGDAEMRRAGDHVVVRVGVLVTTVDDRQSAPNVLVRRRDPFTRLAVHFHGPRRRDPGDVRLRL